jgi:hypothetical protein
MQQVEHYEHELTHVKQRTEHIMSVYSRYCSLPSEFDRFRTIVELFQQYVRMSNEPIDNENIEFIF